MDGITMTTDLQNIKQVLERMNNEDLIQREQGLTRDERWRSIPPISGRFLFHSVLSLKATTIVEIGMSHGYSTIWMAMAAMQTGGMVHTYEVEEWRYKKAISNFKEAGVRDAINPVLLEDPTDSVYPESIDLAFIDAEKEDYVIHFNNILPNLSENGVIIADNIISHKDEPAIQEFARIIHTREDLVSTILPIGKGLSYSQKLNESLPTGVNELFSSYQL